MDGDLRLDGGNVIVEGDVFQVTPYDVTLDNPLRRSVGGGVRRAFVHDFNDGLTMNWTGDYPGGVTIEGNVLRCRNHDVILDHPARRRTAGGLRRALVHDFNDGLTLNWANDYPGGITLNGTVNIPATLLLPHRPTRTTMDVAAELADLKARVAALERA